MGGCRCVYRKCQNSTSASPGLHYFHFPVRDPPRCELWIQNARKPEFRTIEKDRLRNKVVCSIHFEDRCFTNEKHDRLIHNAVPTLGAEDDSEVSDPLLTHDVQQKEDDNIMLIPIDADNTKFALPNVEFAGMSYTIFDDAVIPTSKIEDVIMNELKTNSGPKIKDIQIKSVVKKIKTNLPFIKKPVIYKPQDSGVRKPDNNQVRIEAKSIDSSINNNITSYSVSTNNGDVSISPSIQNISNSLPENVENSKDQVVNKNSPLDISLELKNENEYVMSVSPVCLVYNSSVQDEEICEETPTNDKNEYKRQQNEEVAPSPKSTQELEKDYIKMINNNSKQIKHLKRLVQKQSKMSRLLWQRKQMPHFRQRKISKTEVIDALKDFVKPSLLAILKLELLPVDEIVLNDQEEKFITDLYTENPECYNLLRTKFKWNLPSSEKIEEPLDMECSEEN